MLNSKLFEYIRKHNTTVHGATGQTPSDRYLRDISHARMPVSSDWLNSCFMNRVKRRVKNDATIILRIIRESAYLQPEPVRGRHFPYAVSAVNLILISRSSPIYVFPPSLPLSSTGNCAVV